MHFMVQLTRAINIHTVVRIESVEPSKPPEAHQREGQVLVQSL